MKAFEAAILRDFGGLEDFERVLIHALRRSCGQRVLLSLMADDTLWLICTRAEADPLGAVLLDLAAPAAPCTEEALALRVRVIDWRHSSALVLEEKDTACYLLPAGRSRSWISRTASASFSGSWRA